MFRCESLKSTFYKTQSACTINFELYGQLVSETLLPFGIVWTIYFGDFLLIAIDFRCSLLIGIARTIEFEGGLLIAHVRTSGFGDCLLFGIVRTNDCGDCLLI